MKRRKVLKSMATGAAGLTLGSSVLLPSACAKEIAPKKVSESFSLKGKINHSVCRWCYSKIPMEEFCEAIKGMGIHAMDLTKPSEWPILKKYGIQCSMATADFISLTAGFNNPENHVHLQTEYRKLIDQAATAGISNVICFSGNRNGISEEQGLENCAKGLEPLLQHAQKQGITLIMELLNSKVDHKGYQCDHTTWGVQLAKKLDTPAFKLLYDIYHMQIMEGDIIATIKASHPYIAHYHTGGVPGRNEINDSQELYYPAIMKAIVETGYQGYIAQEFIPTYDKPLKALEEAIKICDL